MLPSCDKLHHATNGRHMPASVASSHVGIACTQHPQRLVSCERLLRGFMCARPSCLHVLFSSSSASLGISRHSDYACANAYLDALNQLRAEVACARTQMAWGAVSNLGLASNHEVDNTLDQHHALVSSICNVPRTTLLSRPD